VFICGLLLVAVVTPRAEGLLTLPASGLSKRTVHCSDRCRMYLLRYATRSSTRSWWNLASLLLNVWTLPEWLALRLVW